MLNTISHGKNLYLTIYGANQESIQIHKTNILNHYHYIHYLHRPRISTALVDNSLLSYNDPYNIYFAFLCKEISLIFTLFYFITIIHTVT